MNAQAKLLVTPHWLLTDDRSSTSLDRIALIL